MSELAEKAALLRQVDLFESVPADDLESLCHSVHTAHYADGQRIFAEGDEGDSVYVIQDGVVKISTAHSGEEHVISTCYTGDIVGELALLDGRPRSATASASGPTTLLMISRDEFLRFILGRPKVMLALLDTLTMRARRLSGIVESNIEFLGKMARGDFDHATSFALRFAPAMFKVAPSRPLLRRAGLESTESAPAAALSKGSLFMAASASITARNGSTPAAGLPGMPTPDLPD